MNQRTLSLVMLSIAVAAVVGCSKPPTEDELMQSAVQHQSEDEYDDALRDFRLLTEQYPKSDKVPEALLAMGVICQNKKKEYRRAESLYTQLALNFPGNPVAQSAAYERARILMENLHQPDSARIAYQYFLQHYPDAMSASSAKIELDSLNASTRSSKR